MAEYNRDDLVFIVGYVVGAYSRRRGLPLDLGDDFGIIIIESINEAIENLDKQEFINDAIDEIKEMTDGG